MNHDTLIRMVNQIGTYFESMPDRSEALEGIATHLQKFWDPRMRPTCWAKRLRAGRGSRSTWVWRPSRNWRRALPAV
ncbi:MAG: formate dehydrogenase subunit delta [Gammaproteobacteria bacterium]|nr:formate dehydrogenase subunit delta [Gammaproteobacteria bacterium]MBU0788435.1 formate dehydrogenase subunit delta [Gammaproteobacteria bacterium]MBU0816413.1 formate dehydrogenase subunit delta [Gammaproteobacteria bacterium]MBU1788050.1 formate dehydrogenase subunit delta [Gammaproteobacteria bacterium]